MRRLGWLGVAAVALAAALRSIPSAASFSIWLGIMIAALGEAVRL